MSDEKRVLIVGTGVFGISTAYHLLKRGYKDVTVVDRAESLPAPDAAGTDLNKSKSLSKLFQSFLNDLGIDFLNFLCSRTLSL
jgi:NADPH-dependent 2,4-dienoyl-CoA reductase/sulfur reductase-like enzyme